MGEKISFSTGFVRAAGYANKLRRTMIAITKGILKPDEAARSAAQINMKLFDILRANNVEKDDVVRIRLSFSIVEDASGKKIVVDWDTLTIEVYKSYKVIKSAEVKELPEVSVIPYNLEIENKLKSMASEYTKSSESVVYYGDKWLAEVTHDDKGNRIIRIKYKGSKEEMEEFINKLK
ncbi:MAG: single- stranded DNA-binding family protein [Candidatus Njordarchaeia archaeon]